MAQCSNQNVKDSDDVTRVVNIRHNPSILKNDPSAIYIGRYNYKYKVRESKWANPFIINKGKNDRDEVCKSYRKYILTREDLLNSLHELKGKT